MAVSRSRSVQTAQDGREARRRTSKRSVLRAGRFGSGIGFSRIVAPVTPVVATTERLIASKMLTRVSSAGKECTSQR